jgi:integrase
VLVNLEPSTQAGVRSHLGTAQKDPNRKAKRKLASLVECLGNLEMKDITTEILQSLVTSYHKQGAAPKTVKNIVVSLRMLWTQAKAWGYVTHDPFPGLVLPDAEPVDVPYYRAAQMISVIEIAQEPYRTLFWLAGETGIRRGEVCALRVQDVILERDGKPLEQAIVVVQRKVWNGIIGRPKSKRPRVFVLSPQLTEHPVTFVVPIQAQPDHLLFTNSKGGLLHPDNLVKRHLKPVLVKAGIKQGGMHAFRHGNATMMDRLNVPMKIRQDRLGHIDARTTMGYTHAVSDDEKRAAAQMGEILCANARKAEKTNAFAGCEGLPVQ